jgi:hypothetical protein
MNPQGPLDEAPVQYGQVRKVLSILHEGLLSVSSEEGAVIEGKGVFGEANAVFGLSWVREGTGEGRREKG